ncbi:hypothetical protein CLV60_10170 [Dyadobacter jiangsuensis]|uniref:Uncharacterized protein n=1 Tax=Dyadobacter jiangsuensis TaxID=1591085 RepID=A0A2P8GIA9_9BACT|nr:hypothetical protein CLV60_10170 [Dyadobacter jiangsuensis]
MLTLIIGINLEQITGIRENIDVIAAAYVLNIKNKKVDVRQLFFRWYWNARPAISSKKTSRNASLSRGALRRILAIYSDFLISFVQDFQCILLIKFGFFQQSVVILIIELMRE